ncbi:hypothetical protein HPB52_024079 [Rhipicephalus sanguineus]|uniref:Uncharacterized protein n=1 Tax=Rhipicephalus sanguineus TaxID=34632 RepID=A0A9D4PRU5_RHISA|nr:hypothetical protein HPB52_024079 [Rhipicephalus sanguineus]
MAADEADLQPLFTLSRVAANRQQFEAADVKEKKLAFPRNVPVAQEAVAVVNWLGPESLLSVLVKAFGVLQHRGLIERMVVGFPNHHACLLLV